MDLIPLFRQSAGLVTADDPTDVLFDPESGVSGLQATVNVTHRGNKGRIGRREGFTSLSTGDYHSLFCDGGDCYVIEDRASDAAIMRVSPDFTLSGIRSGLTKGARTSWAQDGSKSWYVNGSEHGYVEERVSYPWPDQSDHVGSVTTRVFSPAPVGRHISIGHSRMWIADGDMLYYSEPFAYGKFSLGRNFFRFHSDVLMVRVVEAGVFVSDAKAIWFYQGTSPKDMQPTRVADYPAIEWSLSINSTPGREIGRDNAGDLYFVTTPEGLCSLSTLGVFNNETKNSIVYPETGQSGASLVRGYNVIQCME